MTGQPMIAIIVCSGVTLIWLLYFALHMRRLGYLEGKASEIDKRIKLLEGHLAFTKQTVEFALITSEYQKLIKKLLGWNDSDDENRVH